MLYISLAIIQTILFEAHFLVYVTVRDIFGLTGHLLFVLKIITVTLSLSFVCASALAHTFENKITRFLYRVSAIWFGFLAYFLLASALYWLVILLGMNNSAAADFGKFFLAIALAVGIYGLINANTIRIRRITVTIPRLPETWKNRKMALVSDVHLGQIRGKSFAEKITKIINTLSPDIVALVGDVFDGVKVDADKCAAPFSNIKVPLGTFFVYGNHEEFDTGSTKKYGDALRRVGIKVLENQLENIDGVEIIGVSDNRTTKKAVYKETLEKIIPKEKKHPRILLKHTPVSTAIAEEAGIDLELSGHTHAGQVFPFNLITPLIFKKRSYGLSKFGSMSTYTSSGVGTWGPPMRIGTNPEIVIISFENRP